MPGLESMIVNPFGAETSGTFEKKGQEIEEVAAIEDPLVAEAVLRFKFMSEHLFQDNPDRIGTPHTLDVMSPLQIDQLLQHIRSMKGKMKKPESVVGVYMPMMIMKSYKAGYNDFILNTGDSLILDLLDSIVGRSATDKLRYTVHGPSKPSSGLRFVEAVHRGDILREYAFDESVTCDITIDGNAPSNLGYRSENTTFVINGDVGDMLGYNTSRCTYRMLSSVGSLPGILARYCTFQAVRHDTYAKLCYEITPGDNLVQLINEKGKVLQEVKR